MAIKHDIYDILVKMVQKCYCFFNVLTNPQILSYHKAKSVDECQRMFLIAALSGSHEVHCVSPPNPSIGRQSTLDMGKHSLTRVWPGSEIYQFMTFFSTNICTVQQFLEDLV